MILRIESHHKAILLVFITCCLVFKPVETSGGTNWPQIDSLETSPHHKWTNRLETVTYQRSVGFHNKSTNHPWTIEWIAHRYDNKLTNCSIKIDGSDRPHIAFGGNNLYYAWHNGSDWLFEVVEYGIFAIRDTSIELDSNGQPHILFYHERYGDESFTWGELNYAHRDGDGWHKETIEGSDLFFGISLDLDGDDQPHVSYSSYSGYAEYAYLDEIGWHTFVIDANTGETSLVLDTAGQPHISYAGSDSELRYAFQDSAGWHTEVVDNTWDVGDFNSIALDSNGYPHISYYDQTNQHLKYASKDAGGWQFEFADSLNDVGLSTSLALDSEDNPHISYHDYLNGNLKYTYRDEGGWHPESVDTGGRYTALALDGAGEPHISHIKIDNGGSGFIGELRYASKEAGDWYTEEIRRDLGDVGGHASIAVDPEAYPHISYHGEDFDDLRYAYQDAAGWHNDIVDSVGSVGKYTSLALDSNGYPHISYFDETHAALKYTYQDAQGWHYTLVDNGGRYSSLALDSHGYPHISYRGEGWILKYAFRDSQGWQIFEIDSGISISILRLDNEDDPHLIYVSATEGLIYTYQDSTGWHNEVLNVDGQSPTLTLDDRGYPHLSYQESFEDRIGVNCLLVYAYREAAGWHYEIFESVFQECNWSSSLELDPYGTPHLSFANNLTGVLNHAYRGPMGWISEVVDNQVLIDELSAAMDSTGYPHIVYYDDEQGDLKYAHPNMLPPNLVVINGPLVGLRELPVSFIAAVSPTSFTSPLTYTWQATGLPTVIHTGGSTDTVSFTWGITGTHNITVTAENTLGLVSDYYNVHINEVKAIRYFPMILAKVASSKR